ncbi:DUF5079 family protein (plasmid) [Staphylococcus aureus]|nr:DUF5079 family protein [Staphylococcus aureus]
MAIIIKLSAFGGLFYIRTVVPNTADEEKFITLSILINIAVDLLLVRSYFNYALYKSVKKISKTEWMINGSRNVNYAVLCEDYI